MIDKTDEGLDHLYQDETLINSNGKEETVVFDFYVGENDHKVLDMLGNEKSNYTFKGLMRKLGIHQETLSRSLRRLGDLGLIEKSDVGYRISKKGSILARANNKAAVAYVPLFQTFIPPNMNATDMVNLLAGKWFKGLRWLGMIDGEMGCTLQWISEENTYQINLRIDNNYVTIESNASTDCSLEAMISAYRIFERVMRHYSSKYGGLSFYFTFLTQQLNN
ncbi:MAG: ArsR family transcriptional regulator [Nitrososphaerales archaeon]